MTNEPNVAPYFETAEFLGLPVSKWMVKIVKSKTLWFSTAVTTLGALEAFLPQVQTVLGSHYGAILGGIGIVTAVLRFATTKAIAEK